jgi:PIN domain nuclease of toxin-antitoxin system
MRLLLDTHVLLWAVLEDSDNELLVSAASAWEIATKWRLGKLSQAAGDG